MQTINRLVVALDRAQDADTTALDIGADLLAEGTSLNEIGRVLNRTRQSVTERFVSPPSREYERIHNRVKLWRGRHFKGVRISSFDRFVVFDDGTSPGGSWRIVRHVDTPERAIVTAIYLGENTGGELRFVRRPRDLRPETVSPWALPYPLGADDDLWEEAK